THLAESCISEGKSQRFPPLQIVLLDEKLSFEIARDEVMKSIALPYWQAGTVSVLCPQSETRVQKGESLFGQLIPSLFKVKLAQARIDQKLGLLRCLEAVRLYAAEHGKPPA